MDEEKLSGSDDSSSTEVDEDFNTTDVPSSENFPGKSEDVRSKINLDLEIAGSISFGTSILEGIREGYGKKVDTAEDIFKLPGSSAKRQEFGMELGEAIKGKSAKFTTPLDSRGNTAESLEEPIPMDKEESSGSSDTSSTELMDKEESSGSNDTSSTELMDKDESSGSNATSPTELMDKDESSGSNATSSTELMDKDESSGSNDTSSMEINKDSNTSVEPSDDNLPRQSENLPGAAGPSTEKAKLRMFTDEDCEDVWSKKEKNLDGRITGSIIFGSSLVNNMANEEFGIDGDVFMLRGPSVKEQEFAMECDEAIKATATEFSLPPDSAEDVADHMKKLKIERRLLSDFEKKGGKNVFDGDSYHAAQIKQSYLTVNNVSVKYLPIHRPSYDLISKDYRPMVGFVGKSYRIVIDVSSFSIENIAVHVADDMVDVHATENHEDLGVYKCASFHKAYKMPRNVNREKLYAHVLKPLQLLCICAPVKEPAQ